MFPWTFRDLLAGPFRKLASQVKTDCVDGIWEFLTAALCCPASNASHHWNQAKGFLIRVTRSQLCAETRHAFSLASRGSSLCTPMLPTQAGCFLILSKCYFPLSRLPNSSALWRTLIIILNKHSGA